MKFYVNIKICKAAVVQNLTIFTSNSAVFVGGGAKILISPGRRDPIDSCVTGFTYCRRRSKTLITFAFFHISLNLIVLTF